MTEREVVKSDYVMDPESFSSRGLPQPFTEHRVVQVDGEGGGEERLRDGPRLRAPHQEGGHSHLQNTVLCRLTEREVVKCDYVLGLDTGLLLKRAAAAIN